MCWPRDVKIFTVASLGRFWNSIFRSPLPLVTPGGRGDSNFVAATYGLGTTLTSLNSFIDFSKFTSGKFVWKYRVSLLLNGLDTDKNNESPYV